ncbi:hypothetical protein BOSP111201_26955 [Bordetella sputigena]|uniref:2-hydroxyacid dehydrogenase n=1 Tax=Bordetella sputigena TaxID=1416810 RepID=UPI0039F13650
MKAISVALHGANNYESAERLRQQASQPLTLTSIPDDVGGDALRRCVENVDVLITNKWNTDIKHLSGLRLLQVNAAGYDQIDLDCLPRTTAVCRADGHGPGIAEYILGAMLASSHAMMPADRTLRLGQWRYRGLYYRPLRRELSASTLGIIGYGAIGQALAAKAGPLLDRVVALSRSNPSDPNLTKWYEPDALSELLAVSDYVAVCLPLTPQTLGMIGAAQLAVMKKTAVIINVGRGPIIDEHALYSALESGMIGGAVLDVWWNYPARAGDVTYPSARPFHKLENVVLTPHISGWSEQILERRWKIIAQNVEAVMRGGELSGIVLPARA